MRSAPTRFHLINRWILLLLFILPSLAEAASKPSSAEAAQAEAIMVANYLLDQCVARGWKSFTAYALVSNIILCLLIWPAGKLLAGENGNLKKALQLTAQWAFVGLIFLALIFVCIRMGSLLSIVVLGFGSVVAYVKLVMDVYKVSMGRAIGLFICGAIVSLVGEAGAEVVFGKMPWTEFNEKPDAERKALIAKWQEEKKGRNRAAEPDNASASASASSPSAAAGAPLTLVQVYENLQKEREKLDLNDAAAVARFNEHAAEYNAMKATAAPATPAKSASAKPATPSAKKAKTRKQSPGKNNPR
jgi:hypothetical protein